MGHAGAIISGGSGKASDKIKALRIGITVCSTPADLGVKVQSRLGVSNAFSVIKPDAGAGQAGEPGHDSEGRSKSWVCVCARD